MTKIKLFINKTAQLGFVKTCKRSVMIKTLVLVLGRHTTFTSVSKGRWK